MPKSPSETFKTHASYLQAFDMLTVPYSLLNPKRFYPDLYTRICNASVLPDCEREEYDAEALLKSLHNAWGTEFLLLSSQRIVEEEELLKLSNNWSCIQTYYVLYHCTQALLIAKGQSRPDSHPKTQRVFCSMWAERPICLAPWSLACSHDDFTNVPNQITIDPKLHVWSSCDEFSAWSIASKSLMTTRRDALKKLRFNKRKSKQRERLKEWKAVEKTRISHGKKPRSAPEFPLPNLTSEDKVSIDTRLRPYTIMDYLYRLRIKTNYEDSNIFTDGPENDTDSKTVRRCFCNIASGTLFLHELAIRNIVGVITFTKWVNDWVATSIPKDSDSGIIERLEFIAKK